MPKSRTTDRTTRKTTYIRSKFKLGGRKSMRSALRMSTEELLEELDRHGLRGRDRAKIRKVLDKRGVNLASKAEKEADLLSEVAKG